MIKPEAILRNRKRSEIVGLRHYGASAVRTEWYQAVRRFFRIRLCGHSDRATVSVRCRFALAEGNRRPGDDDLSRMDEGRAPDHDGGLPRTGGACWIQHMGLPIGIQIAAPNHANWPVCNWRHAYMRRRNGRCEGGGCSVARVPIGNPMSLNPAGAASAGQPAIVIGARPSSIRDRSSIARPAISSANANRHRTETVARSENDRIVVF